MAGKVEKVKIIISGRVQMVGFRYFTLRTSEKLGIKGYVKNLSSGKVEIVACGKDENLDELIELVSKGPPAAEVISLKVDRHFDTLEEFKTFEIRR